MNRGKPATAKSDILGSHRHESLWADRIYGRWISSKNEHDDRTVAVRRKDALKETVESGVHFFDPLGTEVDGSTLRQTELRPRNVPRSFDARLAGWEGVAQQKKPFGVAGIGCLQFDQIGGDVVVHLGDTRCSVGPPAGTLDRGASGKSQEVTE
jgi:hypothetical protein